MPASDARFFKRFLFAGTIMVTPDTAGTPRTIKGELADISFKGGGFYAKEQLNRGDRVEFFLANQEMDVKLRGRGKIVAVSQPKDKGLGMFRYGIEFSILDSETLRDIVLGLEKKR